MVFKVYGQRALVVQGGQPHLPDVLGALAFQRFQEPRFIFAEGAEVSVQNASVYNYVGQKRRVHCREVEVAYLWRTCKSFRLNGKLSGWFHDGAIDLTDVEISAVDVICSAVRSRSYLPG